MNGLRADRWLTLSLVRPLSAVLRARQPSRVPILMYHSVADDIDDSVAPYFRTVTTPRRFAEQMQLLHRDGYQCVTLSDALARLTSGAEVDQCRSKLAVLTFDDGLRDFCTAAFPILDRLGFSATVFVTSACIGGRFLTGRECLSSADIRYLHSKGIEFGSHSVSHRKLVELDRKALDGELGVSKWVIEQTIGDAVTLFSYPYRFPDENRSFTHMLSAMLSEHGYAAGVTTVIGRAGLEHEPLFLPRLPVNDCDDSALLNAKLQGHYDWLRAGQLLRKRTRALLGERVAA